MDPAMQQQLLQQLRDIHEPTAIGLWPFAIGWWILIVLAVVIVIGLTIWLYLRHKRDAYRRAALKIADGYFSQYQTDSDAAGYLGNINQLLRRLLNQISRHESIAEASGSEWVNLLNQFGQDPLSDQANVALSEQVYQPEPSVSVPILHEELISWIKTHRRVVNV